MPLRMPSKQAKGKAWHKYGAVATTVDGITFASKAEAKRYCELKLLQKAGVVRNLTLQVPLVLSAGNDRRTSVGKYVADFVYEELVGQDWCHRVEDVKGFKTPLYRWKKKHVEAQYGITITEVGSATTASKAKRAQTPRRSAAP